MRNLFIFIISFLPLITNAKISVDGIYYNIHDDKTASVCSGDDFSYKEDINIPSTITYSDVTYSVTSIEANAFLGYFHLKSVTIPNSVKSIEGFAFFGCSALTSIEIPNSVTSIGYDAFYGCSGELIVNCNISNASSQYQSGFSGSNFSSLIIGNEVESIGDYAFYGCSSLNSVTIGNNVKSIGNYAFRNCSGLTSVTIPNSMKSIGYSAFSGCYIEKQNFINNSSLDAEARNYWGAMIVEDRSLGYASKNGIFIKYFGNQESFIIPDDILSIGESAFSGCSGLTSVMIPNSVTSIGNYAFQGCSGLTSVTIPNSVTSIGRSAFSYCSGLTSIDISNSITSIGNYVFSGCSALTSIEIPNSVTSIGNYAFRECSGLTSVTIPNSVTSIEETAFYGCSSLIKIMLNSNAIASKSYKSSPSGLKDVFGDQVKEFVIGNDVTSIGDYAFSGYSALSSIEIPKSIISIGNNAFSGCSALTSIEIPNSVTSIGYDAFYGCSGELIVNCNISNASSQYQSGFSGSSFSSLIIGNEVEVIGEYAFYGCSSLNSVTIGNNVKSIGYRAFYGCSSLIKVKLNSNAIVSKAYSLYSSVKNIFDSQVKECIIGDDVTSIGAYVFYGCSSLNSVTIGNNVTSIGNYAFCECSGLTSVTIPNSVSSIDFDSFYGCYFEKQKFINNSSLDAENNNYWGATIADRIEKGFVIKGDVLLKYLGNESAVTIPNDIKVIGQYAMSSCSSLTSVTIPNSVTSIGQSAFSYCSALTSIEIPNSITKIDYGAFNGTPWYANKPDGLVYIGLIAYEYKGTMPENTSISIKENTISINEYAFSNCHGLISITIPNTITSIRSCAFSGCSSLTSITIPESVTEIVNDAFNGCFFAEQKYINNSRLDEKGNNYWGATIIDSKENGFIIKDGVLIKYVGNETSVTIPSSVTKIGSSAFSCLDITSVTIPGSVTSISDYAFNCCIALTSITIPNSVTSIGREAFNSCSKLTSITIPNSVTIIEAGAFNNSRNLLSIDIPNSVTIIKGEAFYGTAWYDNQPDGLVYAGRVAYKYKGTMPENTSIILKNNTVGISDFAFYNCSNLSSITIPANLTEIGEGAFGNCNSLQNINMMTPTPPNISANTFSDYSATLNIIDGTQELYQNHEYWKNFINISGSYNTDIDQHTDIVYFEDESAKSGSEITLSLKMKNTKEVSALMFDLYLPEGVNLNTNTYGNFIIKYNAETKRSKPAMQNIYSSRQSDGSIRVLCYGNSADVITGNEGDVYDFPLTLSENIKEGEHKIFLKNIEMTSPQGESTELFIVSSKISVSNSVPETKAEIDGIYYYFNHSLKTATVTYGNSSYNSYSGSVVIPNKVVYNDVPYDVKAIGDFAFAKCTNLNSVVIPNSITYIGNSAFNGSSKITSIAIPESVALIEECAFSGCDGLTSIIVADNNNTYDSRDNCNAIIETETNMLTSGCKTSVIPNSVVAIGNSAFSECRRMSSVTIPESVTSIGDYAFYGCAGLTEITIPNSVVTLGYGAFSGCKGMKTVAISESINAIRGEVFSGCSSMESVTIPDGITAIGSNAFENCSKMTAIKIPESVMSIGRQTFEDCNSMETVDVAAMEPPHINENTFSDYSAILLVANGCKEIYQNTKHWKNFYTIIDGSDQKIPLTYYDYEGTPKTIDYRTTWNRVLESTPNAIAIVDDSQKSWAENQKNVLVKDGDKYYCPYFVLTDLTQDYDASAIEAQKTGFYTPVDFTVIKGIYKRFSTTGFKTLCLPFDLSISETTGHSKLYTYDKYDRNSSSVTFKRVKGGYMVAGTPCIIYDEYNYDSDSSITWNINLSNKKITASSPSQNTNMRGTYVTTSQYQGTGYSVNSYGSFALLHSYLHPFRACFIPESVLYTRGLNLKLLDDDQLEEKNTLEANEYKTIYTLSGIRINKINVSGVYIIDGKKVYVEVK